MTVLNLLMMDLLLSYDVSLGLNEDSLSIKIEVIA